MYIYEVIDGRAVNINPGPTLEGQFTKPYVSWDGNPANEPKERLHPPRGFKKSDYQKTKVATSTPKKPVEVKLEKLDDLQIDDSLFESMETGTIFDKFCSSEGGIQRGTNVMAVGAPGIGKCVRGNTLIKVRNKKTGELMELTIKEFHEMI